MKKEAYLIDIKTETSYIAEQSLPEDERYVFAYTITIRNKGSVAARLLSRYWLITDGNGNTSEVRGEGVVGEQPYLQPGEEYQYTSGTVLETPIGTMEGHYQMLADDGVQFEAPIPRFSLTNPQILH